MRISEAVAAERRLREEAVAEMVSMKADRERAVTEVRKWLSPGNENGRRGDLVASIRDLAQVAISERGNAETAEADRARLTRELHDIQPRLWKLEAAEAEVERLMRENASLTSIAEAVDAFYETTTGKKEPVRLAVLRAEAAEAERERLMRENAELRKHTAGCGACGESGCCDIDECGFKGHWIYRLKSAEHRAEALVSALTDTRIKLTGALAMLQQEASGFLESVNYDGSGETDSDGLATDIEGAIERADIALKREQD